MNDCIDITNAVKALCNGEAKREEQIVCGFILDNLLSSHEPDLTESNGCIRPYCKNCNQPINTKQVNGKHIFEYCKCCGQKINWTKYDELMGGNE